MKKIVALTMIGLFAASAILFADDAKVMPARVGRIVMALNYATADAEFDADGEEQDLDNEITAYNFGAALEYGVNDWITAAVQWAPGYNFSSEVGDTDAKLNGLADIFAGAKLQIVGPKAPVVNETVRFAVAPGIKIPLPGADFEDEVDNALAGDEFIAQDIDKHTLGLGGRFYADYVINKMFFLNAYSEFIYYLEKKDAGFITYTPFPTYAEADIAYGYDLTLELEPHFEYMLNDGLQLSAGLPLTYTMSPDIEVDGEKVDDSASNLFKIGPNVSVFFMKSVVPFELKLAYMLPLAGVNENKMSTISLQGKIYFKL